MRHCICLVFVSLKLVDLYISKTTIGDPDEIFTSDEIVHTTKVKDMSAEEMEINVAAVAIQLPPFSPANPRVWFIQADAQFTRRGITASRTKYEEIICALPTDYATEVEDLLIDPPEENPYEKLKDLLISRIADSERQKI